MITAKSAREAWTLLLTHARVVSEEWGTPPFINFDTLDEARVKRAYHAASRTTHPDMGGSLERFVPVDRAKHLLLEWLGHTPPTPDPVMASACDRCTGLGYVSYPRGFAPPMRVTCPACRGTGDFAYEHEKGDAR